MNPIQDLFNTQRLAIIEAFAVAGGMEIAKNIADGKGPDLKDVPVDLLNDALKLIGGTEEAIGTALFDSLISTAAGDKLRDLGSGDEADAVRMIKRLLGFGTILPLVTGQITSYLEGVLGDHAPTGLLDAFRDLPQEIGVNFFIGTVLERIFETAVSTPLEEAIAIRTRPARIEWPQLRVLARTHALTDAELTERLRKIGFQETDIPLIKQIDMQPLPVGDLQTAYLDGLLTEAEVLDRLQQLGFTKEDSSLLVQIYLTKAQTEAGALYRTIARNAYASSRISEGQFRSILAAVNTPKASIDLEVQALLLQREVGKAHLSVAQIERLLQDGSIDEGQARTQLTDLGYDETSVNELFDLWKSSASAGKTGLTQQKVLQYLLSKVIDRATAYTMLTGLGVRDKDAAFLVDHPGSTGTTFAHPLDKATIVAAFKDGIISVDDAKSKLEALNVSPDEINLALAVASRGSARGGKKKQGDKVLSVADIKDAYDNSLATLPWAMRELTTIGYTDNDAALITAIWYAKQNGGAPDGWTQLT